MAIQAEKIETNELFIGGEWVAPQGNGRIDVVSPSTEEPIGPVPEGSDGDIDAAVRAARAALPEWSGRPVEERVDALMRLAQALEARGEDTAQRVSMQNGMPISVSRQLEAVFPAVVARYYAGLIAETDLEEDRAGLLGGRIRVVRKPIGGKSAAIVLDDADLSDAAEALFAGMAGALRLGDALWTPRRRLDRWSPPASAIASKATSKPAARRARASSRVAVGPVGDPLRNRGGGPRAGQPQRLGSRRVGVDLRRRARRGCR